MSLFVLTLAGTSSHPIGNYITKAQYISRLLDVDVHFTHDSHVVIVKPDSNYDDIMKGYNDEQARMEYIASLGNYTDHHAIISEEDLKQ